MINYPPLEISFTILKNEIYLDGNSLGVKPNQVNSVVENLLNNQWGKKQIAGWNDIG